MSSEKISVIIPTYKRADNLDRALQSLKVQSFKDFEVIVVNDSGPDYEFIQKIRDVIKHYQKKISLIYVENEKNIGGSASRNIGAEISKAKYLCFLDDDDEFMPNKIEKQFDVLESSEHGAVCTGFKIFKKNKLIYQEAPKLSGNLTKNILMMTDGLAAGSSLMIKRSIFNQLNGFDITFPRHQDWEFMIRFFQISTLGTIPETLLRLNLDDSDARTDTAKQELAKHKFLEKFKSTIHAFGNNESNEIYFLHYFQLAKLFLYEKKYKKFREYIKKASEYKKLSLFKMFKIFIWFIDSYFNFYLFLRRYFILFRK